MSENVLLIALIAFDIIVIPIAIVILVKSIRKRKTFCASDVGVDDQITLDVLHSADVIKWCQKQELKKGSTCAVIAMNSGRFDLKKMPSSLRKVANNAYMLISHDENRQRLRSCIVLCNTAEEELTRLIAEGDGLFILEI